jgi:hypothetical protein
MAAELSTPRSRRALLAAALGGAAAVTAQAVVKPLEVRAADGGNALLGTANESTTVTSFENTDASETSLAGIHDGAGTAIDGSSATGTGVNGTSTDTTATDDFSVASHKTGVIGSAGAPSTAVNTDETGVYGIADVTGNSTGVWGDSSQGTGVYGSGFTGVAGTGDWGVYAEGVSASLVAYNESNVAVYGAAFNFSEAPAAGEIGVLGAGPHTGVGVYGFAGDGAVPAPPSGVGVYARALSTSEIALYVSGKARFTRSARVSISSTATSKKITMAGVTSSSYVVATMQTNVSGLYVRAVVCTTGSFTIYLSKAPGKTVYVGYLVIN